MAGAWIGLIVVAISGCGAQDGDAHQIHGAEGLRWSPPRLVDPTTIKLPSKGYSESQLDPDKDYVVDLPAKNKHGGVTLVGGHNVVVMGGHITVPRSAQPEDRFRRGLYIKDATGTVHVEGVVLDSAPGAVWDGIDIAAPAATVQLENVRVDGVRGSVAGYHGDVVQPWGGVRELRIDRLSASSDYQGLTIPIDQGPIGMAKISRVDLHRISGDPGRGRLLWLTTGARTCHSYPIALKRVFVETGPGRTLGNSIWPESGRPSGCGARARHGFASWPQLPEVSGQVRAGDPPRGPYVPAGVAGTAYSPGQLRSQP